MNKQEKFESEIFPEFRKSFYEELDSVHSSVIMSLFEPFIADLKYQEVINKIKQLQDFPLKSHTIEQMKLDWWRDYLTGNMYEREDKKIALTDFDGKLITFNSILDVYNDFISKKNETIWSPYHNVFTKIFVEWITGIIINACEKIPVNKRIEFLNKSISQIEKDQAFEKYTKFKLNEHLNYYKLILQSALTDTINEKQLYSNKKIFSALTENDKIIFLRDYLSNNDFENFFEIIKTIYASIPYQLFSNKESYFHSIFHVILLLITSSTTSEQITNQGRIDSCLEFNNCTYIIEYKLNEPKQAIQQIYKKKYFEKYKHSNKTIFLIGICFETELKNIKEWHVEKLILLN